jgi:hypothetical protein
MPEFGHVDDLSPIEGSNGWKFCLWGSTTSRADVHRDRLEYFATAFPETKLCLPPRYDEEDYIEGSLVWNDAVIHIWLETILDYSHFECADRSALASFQIAFLPIAQAVS